MFPKNVWKFPHPLCAKSGRMQFLPELGRALQKQETLKGRLLRFTEIARRKKTGFIRSKIM
jgi:hypothetical protein